MRWVSYVMRILGLPQGLKMTDPKIPNLGALDDDRRVQALEMMARLGGIAEQEKREGREMQLVIIDHRDRHHDSMVLHNALTKPSGRVILVRAVAVMGLLAADMLTRFESPSLLSIGSLRVSSKGSAREAFDAVADTRFAAKAQYRAQEYNLASRATMAAQYRSGATRALHHSRENRFAERQRNAAAYKH